MKKRFLQMVKKRVHSLRLFPLLVCLGFLIPAVGWGQAGTPEGSWADNAASAFACGTGTEEDPYQIATAEQLAKLSNDVSGGASYQGTFFVLAENIDLSAHRWTPIGLYKWEATGNTTNNSFQGFLDGNDKTISGMYVDERTDKYCGGLFGKITIQKNGSPVGAKDLTITGATVYVDEIGLNECSGAILAGNAMGSDTQSLVFENITVSGSVHVTRTNGSNNIGGMLGYASWVKATNCHADGVSISGASNSGGFVGNDSGSIYENCTASGTIDGAWALGGFVGYSTSAKWQDSAGESTYTKCAADVDVSGNDWRVGGFVGFAEYGKFNNCVAYGDVTSSVTGWKPRVGGFMGECGSAKATNCHAAGTVTSASSDYKAGGFVGIFSGGMLGNCSFDIEKNPGLNAAGEGSLDDAVTGEKTAVVLANICKDYYGGHQLTQKTEAKDPTCTEPGNKEYWTCERCGKHFSDENATEEITEEETIIKATGHSYGEPVWSWSEDGKTCMVTFTCANDETHTESPEVTVTSEIKTPATCTETGVTTYTATVEFNGQTYTDTKDVTDIQATGHSYGEPVWSWSEDGKTCMVTFTCANDETHTESPEVTVTSEIKTPATCTETGVTTYTATVEFNGVIYTDIKEIKDIPATGHDYENGYCTICGEKDPDYVAPEPEPEPEPTYYRVDLRPVEGATVILSADEVEEGGTLTFTIEIAEGYVADDLMVTVSQGIGKAVEVKPDEAGVYTVKEVDGLVTITVYGVTEEPTTAIERVETLRIYATGDLLHVETPTRQRVTIVSMAGALIADGEQEGARIYRDLNAGVYIVRVGDYATKVRVE